MFNKKIKLTTNIFFITVLSFFFLTIIIKINFFLNYFINIDSAFYVKWFSDLSLTNKIFPDNENSFYKNLLLSKDSFLHQLFRRYFNNSSEIYTIVPTVINYLLMVSIGPGFKTFNLGSIFVNSFIPMFCSFYFYGKYKLTNFNGILSVLFIYLIFFTNFYFFYWSPLGIHNYSLLSLFISFLIIDSNYKEEKFFNSKVIFLAILLPCFTHKFNVPLIFLTLFFIIIYRKNYSNKLCKELFYLLSLFILVVSPLVLGFYLNPKNIAFLNTFFSENQSLNSNEKSFIYNLLNYEINIIKFALPKLFLNYYYNLNIIGIFLFALSLLKSNSIILKFFLLSNILIFIFLPVSYFSIRIFNYQLLIVLILLIDYFIKNINTNNKSFNLLVLIIFVCFISLSAYKTFFKKKLDNNANQLIEVYFKGNEKLKDLLFLINKSKQINSSNIIFGSYVAKDLFYSYFYEYNKNENIDDYPSINSLYEKKNNHSDLKSLNINFEKLYSTYYFNILSKEKNIITDPTLDKLCEMRIYNYNNCGNLKKLELFINNKSVKDVFYNGNTYSLFFYKIDPK
jgi:hypothetical protein